MTSPRPQRGDREPPRRRRRGRRAGFPPLLRRPVRRLLRALPVLALTAGLACTGDAGTEPAPSPASLQRVSAPADTVPVGEATGRLEVQVENDLGEAVEGIPVRYTLLSGPGSLSTGLAVSRGDGVAGVQFVAGSQFGSSRIRVDVPSASHISPLEFRVETVPAGEVTLETESGHGQRAEGGSQLPLPFELGVTAASGVPAGGIAVAWEVRGGAADGATLSADTTYTDPEGGTENLLTLGPGTGEVEVSAFAVGGVVTDTVRFGVSAVEALSGPASVDSVRPSPLVAGRAASLFGSGLGAAPEDVEVRVEGVAAAVLEVADGRVRFRVPAFEERCLPTRSVGVRALVRGDPSNGPMVTLRPDEPALSLSTGEARTFRGDEAGRCLQLPQSGQEGAYVMAVGTGSRTAGTLTPMRLIARSGEPADTSGAASSVPAARQDVAAGAVDRYGPASRIRAAALQELRRRRAAGGRAPDRGSPAGAPPSRGDTLDFHFAVQQDLSVSCQDTADVVRAVVRAAGRRFALAEDVDAPAGFDEQDWRELLEDFDEHVFPTDSAYFGGPADIDGNGRVVALFTPRVNGLGPGGSAGLVSGFFLPSDLVEDGEPGGGGVVGPGGEVCPASNEAELLYLRTPDPAGRFGAALPVSQARRLVRTVAAHELQHLLSAEQRAVLGGGDLNSVEEVWLAEGMAHLAEEAVGLSVMGRGTAENIGWGEIIGDRLALRRFNTYHLDNFARLSFYMRAPRRVPVLAQQDPGGIVGLQMRGFAWSFLRWLAGRTAGTGEADLFRQLSVGGPGHERGIANVERVAGASWEELLSGYRAALAVDDRLDEPPAGGLTIPAWDLPSVFAGLHENQSSRTTFPLADPLATTGLRPGASAVDFEVAASTASYFRIDRGRDAPPLALRLRSQNGGAVSSGSSPMLTVMRLR